MSENDWNTWNTASLEVTAYLVGNCGGACLPFLRAVRGGMAIGAGASLPCLPLPRWARWMRARTRPSNARGRVRRGVHGPNDAGDTGEACRAVRPGGMDSRSVLSPQFRSYSRYAYSFCSIFSPSYQERQHTYWLFFRSLFPSKADKETFFIFFL